MKQNKRVNHIETDIHHLMKTIGNPGLVAEELMQNWGHKLNTKEDSLYLAEFFYNFGLNQQIINLSIKLIAEKKQNLPWPYLYEAISACRDPIAEKILSAIVKGAKETGASLILARSETVIRKNTELSQIKNASLQQPIIEAQIKKHEQLDQIEYLRSQGLLEEEKKQIQKLMKMFPEDPEIQTLFYDLEKRKAEDLFSRRPEYVDLYKKYVREQKSETAKESDTLNEIYNFCLQEIQQSPKLAAEFALMFFHFEDFEKALHLAQRAPSSPESDWLITELLYFTERYIELLEFLPQIELKYNAETDVLMACTYIKAQALWELGEKMLAIENMENIARTFPNYRSTLSLLESWKQGFSA